MRILLVSPYHTGSHRQWAEGYREHSAHDVEIVSLPGRFWKWRLSGAAPALAALVRDAVAGRGPDVMLATSMTDLAGLLGLVREPLTGVPAALYMHENQVTYPTAGRTRRERRLGLISWHSVLAADAVAFNSEFHRSAFFDALPGFLGSLPDEYGRAVADLTEKIVVLPVGVDLAGFDPGAERGRPPLILWNHRWDPDKAPEVFLRALHELAGRGVAFRAALAGERFVGQGDEFDADIGALGDRVEVAEYLPREAYRDLLRRSDIVVSTARQEFFGVSVVEAMAAGALPILPGRLVYPERIPAGHRGRCLFGSFESLVSRLEEAIGAVGTVRRVGAALAEIVRPFDWTAVAPRYDEWLEGVACR